MLYDGIGKSYSSTRGQEPRIVAAIAAALGDARSVVNVGAGVGAYEPTDREVVAIEPSETMIAQRPVGAAPAIRASAENLPLPDKSFDAAMAVNTLQHWSDLRAGLRELRRVARKRVVIFLRDAASGAPFWLTDKYFPALDPSKRLSAMVAAIRKELGPLTATPVKLPSECVDGVFAAYWARPEMYLDDNIRRNISNFALARDDLADGIAALRRDLASGAWDRKYGALRSLPEIDLGHRVVVAEVGAPPLYSNAISSTS